MQADVSIIIPTFNRAEILKETIESVLAQTHSNLEIIVVDDASTDNTRNIFYWMQDPRVKVLKKEINSGVCQSRIDGIHAAEANYIAFLDDDDQWACNHIYNLLKTIKTNDEYDLAISDYTVTINNDHQQTHLMEEFCNDFTETIHVKPGPFFQCCLFKSSLLQQPEDLFDTNAIPSEDWDFFMNLSVKNPLIVHSPHIGFNWNYSPSSQSADLKAEAGALEYIIEKHWQDILDLRGKKVLSEHYRRIARVYERAECFQNAAENYRYAYGINPTSIKNIWYRILVALDYNNTHRAADYLRKLRKTPLA